MAAWMLLARGGLVLPIFLTFGMTVDSERFRDPYVALPLDREMDARLTRYVPVHRATLAALEGLDEARAGSSDAAIRAAELWERGRRRGELLPAWPERYGDDSFDGPKGELVTGAFTLSARLAGIGRAQARRGDRAGARRFLAAALGPIRTVRLFDLRTAMTGLDRFLAIGADLRRAGFAHEAERAEREATPAPREISALMKHLRRLRAESRTHCGSSLREERLKGADLVFERALARGARSVLRERPAYSVSDR